MQRVTIIGLGLIGGSIGMALREWSSLNSQSGSPVLEITGFDSNVDRQGLAKKLGAVDKTEWELNKAVRTADVVIMAVPVREIETVLADIAPHLQSGTVVTDTGSTKQNVMTWADAMLPRTVSFVGGHPMAGTEQSLEGATAELFRGATWCVTPSVLASEDSVRTVLGVIAAVGAEPYFVDPVEHDAFVGGISHLPALLSAAMVTALGNDQSWRDMKGLAAGGYRDMSRLAGGNPAMHRDIVMTNRLSVERWLTTMESELARIRMLLDTDDATASEALFKYFDDAQTVRAEWSTQPSRSSEMALGASSATVKENLSEQMGRMFFGNFMRRKPPAARQPAPPPRTDSDNGNLG